MVKPHMQLLLTKISMESKVNHQGLVSPNRKVESARDVVVSTPFASVLPGANIVCDVEVPTIFLDNVLPDILHHSSMKSALNTVKMSFSLTAFMLATLTPQKMVMIQHGSQY